MFKTEREVKEQYVQCMGPELGQLFAALWNEVAWLHLKWAEYVELYGSRPSRLALINQAASEFFKIVEISLFEDTLLHITRLTDPPRSAGKDNLTIQRLATLIPDKSLASKVEDLIDDAVARSAFCRDWRNRHIAHMDLKLALDKGAQPLARATRDGVNLCLEAIGNVLNAIDLHYMNSDIVFEGIPNLEGAVALLYVLDDGLSKAQERIKRLSSGEYRPEEDGARDL